YPDVALDADGDLVIVWQSLGQDGDGFGVYGQRYDNTGAVQGGEFLVNTTTANNQLSPRVGMDASGNFVAVWVS
ncbi:MAG: hypothetical protein KDC32_27475, partial [Saprospiraceae bacterium]|nr:hypothetical protein [Saprospiraceae bacterium]